MNITPEKTLFLIDGSAFLYRAYYGLKPLHTSSGQAVQAVFSFCRTIKKLIDQFGMQQVAIVWDSKGKTSRHTLFEEYKSTRQAPPSDIFQQKELIIEFADLIQIAQIAKEGWEADDLMYSLAKDYADQLQVVLVSADKDLRQALSDTIIIYDPLKQTFLDRVGFEQKYGFEVKKVPFYYGLLGDASDNIPGVKGVGKKIATDLVQQFDSLEDLFARINEVKSERIARLLADQKENAFLSRELFTLQYFPLKTALEDFAFNANNWQNALPLFKKLEFTSLIKSTTLAVPEDKKVLEDKIAYWKSLNFICVQTAAQLQEMVEAIKKAGFCAVDTETNSIYPLQSDLIGLSFCVTEGTAYYIPAGHKTGEKHLSLKQVVTGIKEILEDPAIKKYMHHARYDILVLHNQGIYVQGLAMDTLIAARLIIPDWQKLGLKSLSLSYFNEAMISWDEAVQSNEFRSFKLTPLWLATLYAAADAHQTLKLVRIFEPELQKEHTAFAYYNIEHPLIEVLCKMEVEGIQVDTVILDELRERVSSELQRIDREIHAYLPPATETFNLNSPKQIQHILFNLLQLAPLKKSTKGTGYSTDWEVLQHLALEHPVPALLMRHRELSKLKSTYIDGLPEYINPVTRKIHTHFSQTIVVTGRLSSSDPNMQNIPASGAGLEIRTAFKAPLNKLFVSADYSQIELRVMAFLAQEPKLITAFAQKRDIHQETAALLFQVPPDQITPEQRQVGKRINFSILYGVTPFGLSKDLNISFKEAKDYIDRYFAQYSAVARWVEETIEFTKKNGYVETYWKRRRYIPAIYERNKNLYEEACRIAVNTVAQGTAAQLMKLGMLALDRWSVTTQADVSMILQIHDELLLTVPQENSTFLEQQIAHILENIVPDWNVPLMVNTRQGSDWREVSK